MSLNGQKKLQMPRSAFRGRGIFSSVPTIAWLAGALIVTALIYLPGLAGPFLFDDPPNIIFPLQAWLDGQTGWREIVFGNGSGMLGRPLSMLTFLGNAAVSGLDVLPFKVVNLVIHLACGALVYALFRRLLVRDRELGRHAAGAALTVSALWLVHPIQVSTVLYVVQRMAQLSAMFALIGLITYLCGREALEQGRVRKAGWLLFGAFPLALVASMLSKENGALVPLLCLVIELGCFRTPQRTPSPRAVKWFFALFLALPLLLAAAYFAADPQRLLAGYEGRAFTLPERLLSESRVVVQYIGALLLPSGPNLGLYFDDFVPSRGLLDPPTTVIALCAILGLIGSAWWLRKVIPAFSVGIGIYFAGHAMESTIFPLQLYFEHRNYLPSAGFFLSIVALATWVARRVAANSPEPQRVRRLLHTCGAALLVVLCIATFARASVWRSMPAIAEQGVRQHPQSMRAQLDHAQMLQLQGRTDDAADVFAFMQTMDNAAARHVGMIDAVALQCMVDDKVAAEDVQRLATIAGSKLELAEMLAFENLGNVLLSKDCANLAKEQLATIIRDIVDAAPQPATLTQIWRSRFVASRLFAESSQIPDAINQAATAWMTGKADSAVGVYLANLYLASGDRKSARLILDDVAARLESWDRRNGKLVAQLEQRLESK